MNYLVILIGLLVLCVAGYWLYVRANPKQSATDGANARLDPMLADHRRLLTEIICAYEIEALNYQVFTWCNRKQVSYNIEKSLFAKYPKVLSKPLLELPRNLTAQPDVIISLLAEHGIQVGEHEYVGAVLRQHLLAIASDKAELIVQQEVDAQSTKDMALR